MRYDSVAKSPTMHQSKTLLLMRHAKSSWKNPDLYDHDRPLNKRGERDAPVMGRLLKDMNRVPDAILVSTAVRAMETAKAVAAACQFDGKLTNVERLYGGTVDDYLHVTSKAPADADPVLLIGHNPICEEVLDELCNCDEVMPTSALAEITLPITKWSKLGVGTQGELAQIWRPKELK